MPTSSSFAATALLAAFSIAASAVAQQHLQPPVKLDTLTTIRGERFEQVEMVKIEPAGVTVMHSRGTAFVPIPNLTPEVMEKLGIGFHTREAQQNGQLVDWNTQERILYYEGKLRSSERRFVLGKMLTDKGCLAEEILPNPSGEHRRQVYFRPFQIPDLDPLCDPRTHELKIESAEAGFHMLANGQRLPAYFLYREKLHGSVADQEAQPFKLMPLSGSGKRGE